MGSEKEKTKTLHSLRSQFGGTLEGYSCVVCPWGKGDPPAGSCSVPARVRVHRPVAGKNQVPGVLCKDTREITKPTKLESQTSRCITKGPLLQSYRDLREF